MKDFILRMGIFGPGVWNRHLGRVPEAALPNLTFLNDPCPFWEGKTLVETHQLLFIPPTLNEEPLTHDSLDLSVRGANRVGYLEYSSHEGAFKLPLGPSWILITKEPIPNASIRINDVGVIMVIADHEEYRLPFSLEYAAFKFLSMFYTQPNLGEYPSFTALCQEHDPIKCYGARDGHPECPRLQISEYRGGLEIHTKGGGMRAIFGCRVIT